MKPKSCNCGSPARWHVQAQRHGEHMLEAALCASCAALVMRERPLTDKTIRHFSQERIAHGA